MEAVKNPSTSRDSICLHFVGDIMLSRKIGEKINTVGPKFILEPIQNIIDKSDLLCGNLESPISDSTVKTSGFRAPILSVEVIKDFDVVNLANNHIFDCGDKGVEDTIEILSKNGISYVGIGATETETSKPVIFDIKGKKIAVFGCTTGDLFKRIPDTKYSTLLVEDERILGIIEEIKNEADFVVMMFHGGEEFSPYPPPLVRKSLRNLIYNGVDFIIGHHPHVLSGYEVMGENRFIWYSLGDFVFDSFVEERRRGGILAVKIDGDSKVSFELVPTYIEDTLQVRTAGASLAKTILEEIEFHSQKMLEAGYEKSFPILYIRKLFRYQIERLYCLYKHEGLWSTIEFLLSHVKYLPGYVSKLIKRRAV